MRYVIVAAFCGGLATSAFADGTSKRLTETQLDSIFAGQTAAAGGVVIGAGNFLLTSAGSGAMVTKQNTGDPDIYGSSGVASGQGYGVSSGGGTAAGSGAATSANGNVQVGSTFGHNVSAGGASLSSTSSGSFGGWCVLCTGF